MKIHFDAILIKAKYVMKLPQEKYNFYGSEQLRNSWIKEKVYIIDLFDINLFYGTLPFREEVYNINSVKVYIEFSN